MEEPPMSDKRSITAADNDPLIGILAEENGHTVTRYYTDEAAADAAMAREGEARIARALAAIGAWRHLDWDEGLKRLDRIRHESEPTPLLTLD
jgi:hypothetical protein